jgi:hypothetical protein
LLRTSTAIRRGYVRTTVQASSYAVCWRHPYAILRCARGQNGNTQLGFRQGSTQKRVTTVITWQSGTRAGDPQGTSCLFQKEKESEKIKKKKKKKKDKGKGVCGHGLTMCGLHIFWNVKLYMWIRRASIGILVNPKLSKTCTIESRPLFSYHFPSHTKVYTII